MTTERLHYSDFRHLAEIAISSTQHSFSKHFQCIINRRKGSTLLQAVQQLLPVSLRCEHFRFSASSSSEFGSSVVVACQPKTQPWQISFLTIGRTVHSQSITVFFAAPHLRKLIKHCVTSHSHVVKHSTSSQASRRLYLRWYDQEADRQSGSPVRNVPLT